MPPRPVVAAVAVGWLAAMAWLASEKWGRGPRTGQPPPLLVDLADEVAPQHATWLVYRGDQRIGSAETHMRPRKDGLFDLTTRLRDLELDSGGARVKAPTFALTRTVTRSGDLVAVDARAVLLFNSGWVGLKVNAALKGEVRGEEFGATCEFDTRAGKTALPLEPVRLLTRRAFAPYEPLLKYPALSPGQTWRAANIDPVGEILHAAGPVVGRLDADDFPAPALAPLPRRRPPAELTARVQEQPDELVTPRGQRRTCRVIVFEAAGVTARTWVEVGNGKVLRQEANGLGGTIALVRD